MRVKFLHHSQAEQLQQFPRVASVGRVYELKRDWPNAPTPQQGSTAKGASGGHKQNALWVRAGKYIYNVTSQPDIYNKQAR